MTAAARITQADIDRAMKSVKTHGHEQARIVMDLANQRIEIILGGSAVAPATDAEEWSVDDL